MTWRAVAIFNQRMPFVGSLISNIREAWPLPGIRFLISDSTFDFTCKAAAWRDTPSRYLVVYRDKYRKHAVLEADPYQGSEIVRLFRAINSKFPSSECLLPMSIYLSMILTYDDWNRAFIPPVPMANDNGFSDRESIIRLAPLICISSWWIASWNSRHERYRCPNLWHQIHRRFEYLVGDSDIEFCAEIFKDGDGMTAVRVEDIGSPKCWTKLNILPSLVVISTVRSGWIVRVYIIFDLSEFRIEYICDPSLRTASKVSLLSRLMPSAARLSTDIVSVCWNDRPWYRSRHLVLTWRIVYDRGSFITYLHVSVPSSWIVTWQTGCSESNALEDSAESEGSVEGDDECKESTENEVSIAGEDDKESRWRSESKDFAADRDSSGTVASARNVRDCNLSINLSLVWGDPDWGIAVPVGIVHAERNTEGCGLTADPLLVEGACIAGGWEIGVLAGIFDSARNIDGCDLTNWGVGGSVGFVEIDFRVGIPFSEVRGPSEPCFCDRESNWRNSRKLNAKGNSCRKVIRLFADPRELNLQCVQIQ